MRRWSSRMVSTRVRRPSHKRSSEAGADDEERRGGVHRREGSEEDWEKEGRSPRMTSMTRRAPPPSLHSSWLPEDAAAEFSPGEIWQKEAKPVSSSTMAAFSLTSCFPCLTARKKEAPRSAPANPHTSSVAGAVPRTFSFEELAAATRNFSDGCRIIGQGGGLYKGYIKSINQVVALKLQHAVDPSGSPEQHKRVPCPYAHDVRAAPPKCRRSYWLLCRWASPDPGARVHARFSRRSPPRGLNQPDEIQGRWKENRWPAPAPYWYHGVLQVDRWVLPDLHGRTLQ
ncbi:hypothetical protein ZWY2020_028763 [Hordeum vulgare]|nr:hypothetical protein ZWY2020_028763 [Hordeum vulgare]